MANPQKPNPLTNNTEQELSNLSWDKDFNVAVVEMLGYDSSTSSLRRVIVDPNGAFATATSNLAVKMTISGTSTYIAKAAPASTQASAVWQVKKIDSSSGIIITWADGNANFDNVATDLTSLTYQ